MKYAWIEAQAGWQPIARLCNVLGVSRSGFLQWRKRGPSDRDLANRSLDAQVAVIHAEVKQGYGRIRVTRRLRQSGMRVGAERVRRSLLRQSLRSVYRKKYRVTTDSNHGKPVAQNLLDRVPPVRVLDAGNRARYVRPAAVSSKFAGHIPPDSGRFRHCHIATLD